MDITKNNAKLFSTKVFNTETVNYSAAACLSFLFLLALKQILKLAFGLSAASAVLCAFIAASLLCFVFEKKYVFPKGVSSTPKQLILLVFRCAVDVGFYKILDFLFGVLLKRGDAFVWLAAFTVIFVFNYLFDRLVTFDCIDQAKTKSGGRLYKLFFRNRFVFAAMAVALICISFIFIVYSVFPFGDATVMRMDLYHQYGPLFAELYDRVIEGKSFLYSWESGGGSSFLGNYFNYLSSPFSVIIFLFDKADISYAITVMVIAKCVCSAGTFTFYLKKSMKRHSYVTAAFGVFYAFCAYFLAYYWNIMWIDGMIWLPLIALGIEQIVRSGKGTLYICALALLLVSNYYMGFMACIFSVIYFLAYFAMTVNPRPKSSAKIKTKEKYSFRTLSKNPFINRGVRFALYSVLAAAVCAVTLIPTFLLLRASSATSDSFPTTFESYFSIFDFITSHLSGLETTIRSSGDDVLPNVYCGILTLLLVPLYLINKDIRLKEKAVYILLLLFFLFSFDNNVMNFMWHAFHFPNDLPFRFSYMYTFILLVVAFRALMKIRSIAYKDIMFVALGWILYILVAQKFMTAKMSEASIYITIGFVIVWCAILLCLKNKGVKKSVLAFSVIALSFCEVIVSDTSSILITQSNADYKADYAAYREAIEYTQQQDKGFYRTELTYLERRMDPCYYGYNGISTFSSMAYEDYSGLQYNLGMFGNRINSYTYNPQTPVYNMMFNIKYLIATPDTPTPSDSYFTQIYENKDKSAAVYENDYALPAMFAANTDLNGWTTEEGDPFQLQGDYFQLATGYADVFKECSYVTSQYDNLSGDDFTSNGTYWFNKISADDNYGFIRVEITPQTDGNVYVYLTSPDVKNVEFSGDGLEETVAQNIEEPYILDLGYHKKGEVLSVSMDGGDTEVSDSYVTMYAYTVDQAVFEQGYNKLKNQALDIQSWSDTKIEGTITVKENSYLYTSIPYDEGWRIYVDGEQAETFKIGTCMLGATLKPGTHTVVLKYTPRGLKAGLAVSCVSCAGIAGYYLMRHAKMKKKCKK